MWRCTGDWAGTLCGGDLEPVPDLPECHRTCRRAAASRLCQPDDARIYPDALSISARLPEFYCAPSHFCGEVKQAYHRTYRERSKLQMARPCRSGITVRYEDSSSGLFISFW